MQFNNLLWTVAAQSCSCLYSYYNATIFCKINIDPFIGSAIVGTVTLLSSVVPFLLMDKVLAMVWIFS